MSTPVLDPTASTASIGGVSAPTSQPAAPVSSPITPVAVPPPGPVSTVNSSITTPTTAPIPIPTGSTATTAQNTLGSALAAFGSKLNDLADQVNDPNINPPAPTAATGGIKDVLAKILSLNGALGNKAADTAAANASFGVVQKTQAAQTLANEYATRSHYYDSLIKNAQTNNPEGKDATTIQAQVDQLTREKNSELADIAIQQSAATGDLKTAQDLATAKINAQYEPIQAQIDNLKNYYGLAQNDMSESEKTAATAALAEKQSALDEQKQKDLISYKAKIDNYYKNKGPGNVQAPGTTPNGVQIQVPSIVSPYFNRSQNGTGWVDGSTLQGTPTQKSAIIRAATAAGIKVITNKSQAADLSNIKDVNNKLDTISGIMSNIDQPGSLSRGLYGIGLTKLAEMAQTNPQQAASGSLSSIGLDVLKAISGVQGFRGNQAAIKQVQDHLPTIYDTNATAQQKIAYVRQLVGDREDGLLGQPSNQSGAGGPAGTTRLTGPNGVLYDVPNDKVSAFIKAGGH